LIETLTNSHSSNRTTAKKST